MTEFSDIGFGFGCYHRNCHEKDENNNNVCQYHDFDLKRANIVIVIAAGARHHAPRIWPSKCVISDMALTLVISVADAH